MNNSIRRRFLAGCWVIGSPALIASGGDLNPPTGAILPTDRVVLNAQAITLPYTITQSVSYVLTSDLTGVGGADGILIDANNVTLDFDGFTLHGVAGSNFGIRALGPQANITVRNGNVRN